MNGSPISKTEPEPNIKTKLYSLPYVNDKGYRVGNYMVVVNTDNLPFSSFDEVDHYIYNLFNYAKNEGLAGKNWDKKRSYDSHGKLVDINGNVTIYQDAFVKKDLKEFFKHRNENIVSYIPIKYNKTKGAKGGKAKKGTRKNRK